MDRSVVIEPVRFVDHKNKIEVMVKKTENGSQYTCVFEGTLHDAIVIAHAYVEVGYKPFIPFE